MMNRITLKENGYDYLFSALILILPFSNSIPNLIMGLLCLLFIMSFKREVFSKYYSSNFFFMILLVFYILIKALFNNTFIDDIVFYKKYFYLIIVPLLFIKIKNYNLLKIVAIATINLTILISIYKILKFYYYFNYIPFGDGWATNAVLVLERPYAGLFSIICIVLSFEQVMLKTNRRALFIISLLLSIFFIFFISIRISILTLLLLFIIYGIFYLKYSWKKKISFLLGFLTIFTGILFFNTNISRRFFINQDLNTTIQTTKQFEPRVVIWSCAYEITQQEDFSIFFGTKSYSNIKQSLTDCYSNKITDYSRRNWFLERKFNTHSQLIDIYLIGGLLGILLFLVFLFKMVFNQNRSFYSFAIIISFFMVMCIENVFHRQFGCFIFTIFTGLYINGKSQE